MFLLNWYKEYLEIKYEREARKKDLEFCPACETLKLQLSIANEERKLLISKLTDKPIVEEVKREETVLRPIYPASRTWSVQRQMREAEDREKAKILKKKADELNQAKSGEPLTVSEIEREIGVNE